MSSGVIAGNVFSITVIEQTITPASVATNVAPVQTFTVPGVKTGDAVMVNPPSATAGVTMGSCFVSADDTLSIQFVNTTAGSLTPAAGTHKITVYRKEGVTGATRVMI